MRLFRNHTFYDIYKIISTRVIPEGSGMESQHAETFLSFVLCDIICPVRDERLTMHYQVRHKKMVIALQEFLKDECMGAGEDVHFSNQVGSFAPIWTYYMKRTDDENKTLDQLNKIQSLRNKFALYMSRNINKKYGRWVNEISGTLKQLLNGSGKKKEAGLAICRQLVKACPGKYDSLVDSSNLVGIEGWSKKQREENVEVKPRDLSRECKAEYIPPPTPLKKKRKKRKKRPESPQPPHELSEYELLRLKRIKRNKERLRNLGFRIA